MSWWEDRVVPHLVEATCGTGAVRWHRRPVVAGVHGTVLEIGFGSGLNVPLYPDAVRRVHAVEPSDRAWALAADRLAASPVEVVRSGLDGQRLEEPDDSFDCALVTFSLCTIPDQRAALAEVRRVLAPGGTLHFLEHGLSPDPGVVRWQRRLEPVQRRLGGGCHLTRDPVADLEATGFEVRSLQQEYLRGPRVARPWAHLSRGTATAT
ncbi:class I SAM-dependent methyltransferase [Nocardioides marmoribigeumensis]|uniref:Ubiquinone/menaquinone biosynthesis C-methylase UbiE n=1 Tax=Nocardioides marmoribigeumensis TaxID=433649 RepID=A0ABU2C176_9ACTN|nr:class I SAM-dependent methyltransferase [Nocardioides marmoribigeumensis]MDR7364396.1 ubiquinone/menaquinone biosynthesis C-methylase UbiE [Nocardioides marmoribigeumensis]